MPRLPSAAKGNGRTSIQVFTQAMKLENVIRALAGTLLLTGLALAHYVNSNWIWLSVFVGFNLLQSAFTGFCPAETILKKLGVGKEAKSCCG